MDAMLFKSEALLLHHFRYGENSQIVKVFTPVQGAVSLFFRPSKKHARAGLLQPLSLLDIVFWREHGKDMGTVKEIRLDHAYQNIGRDMYRGSVVLFLNEILVKILKEGTEDPALFSFVKEWLIHYDIAEFDADAHLYFLAHLASLAGFLPDGVYSPSSPVFDLESGNFIASRPSHPRFLEGDTASSFLGLFSVEHQHAFSAAERKVLLYAVLEYFRLHFPDFGELKSLAVLEELFRP